MLCVLSCIRKEFQCHKAYKLFSVLKFAVLIKGGVWKNTEDEILKAAVMKYGLNQWPRISSLLSRKSAKQCKARWYEWLDPAIKKTEWTREEDEKLLHLAKLMPTQWRTIAPIVGRTPTQCLERYEKLLDMAAGKDKDYDPRDDPRRLRPGEIDPNPETKPARPDPVDMDEDEKEMLSEARARLANTKGKKAKRKAREKQLEEARRLATLQKQRELKAAGIELREKSRRGQGVNYAKEVAFERKPAPGFYDTSEEVQRTREIQEDFRPVRKGDLERPKRKEIDAERAKQDAARLKAAERNNIPLAVAKAMSEADGGQPTRRGKMMLPAPQVSDSELETLARQGAGAMDLENQSASGSVATRALIGDYATPARFATPMRTPAMSAGEDRVMLEAQNLRRLQQGQTPLLGGDNPDLSTSDFSGVAPKRTITETPNPMAQSIAGKGWINQKEINNRPDGTSQRGSVAGVAATPRQYIGDSKGGKPLPTPLRDAFGLNDPDSMPRFGKQEAFSEDRPFEGHELYMETRLKQNELRSGLAQLPAPKNEYEIAAPEIEDIEKEEKPEGEAHLMDIEDAEEEQKKKNAARLEAIEESKKRRSQVLQRGLPRPISVIDASSNDMTEPDALLYSELLHMVQFDATEYPIESKNQKVDYLMPLKSDPRRPPDDYISAAEKLLAEEIGVLKDAMGHGEIPIEEYMHDWENAKDQVMYVPSKGQFAMSSLLSKNEKVATLKWEFENIRREMERDAKRAAKLEQKLDIIIGGLVNRQQNLLDSAEQARKRISSATVELKCYNVLHEQEQRSAPERILELQNLVSAQTTREKNLQEKYGKILQAKTLLESESKHVPSWKENGMA